MASLLTIMAVGSGVGKMLATLESEMGQQFIKMAFFHDRFITPCIEITCALLLLIPKTSTIGAVLSAGYWGGAAATEFNHGQFRAPVLIFIALLGLIALFRNPELFQRLRGKLVQS